MANHKNFSSTTLGAAITDTSGTSITVTSETSFPSAPFIISIDTECLLVSVVSGTTWTVTRGYEGSTAATHTNGTAIYHDISAAEADVISSITAAGLALLDDANAAAQLDTLGALPKAGGTLTGNLIMDNMDITLVKLLTLHGEIDDGNSGSSDIIDWNTGTAHKSTLTGNVTFAFTGYGTDAAPAMTAANTPSGVASSSREEAGYVAWMAFDDYDPATAPNHTWYSGAVSPQWIQYQFTAAKTITVYSIRSTTSGFDTYQPKDWTLQGSNNGTDWTTIDTVTSGFASGENATRKYFTVDAPGSYVYYRINVTATVGAGGHPTIDEIQLFDTTTVDPAAPCFLTLKLVQDGTGGRTVTWPATVKGTPLYDLAANAVTNLLFYWDGTYYWLLNNNGKVAVPASAAAKGITGQWAAHGSNFCYCSATDTWVRAALATWS